MILSLKSVGAGALLALFSPAISNDHPRVFPPDSIAYGLSYADRSAEWWQWFMEHPVEGHPSIDDSAFDVASGQSGKVWFLATPLQFGTATPTPVTRRITISASTALFVGMFNSEWSSNEGFATEAEQREFANWQGDHVVNLACTLDGQPVANLGNYRFESDQFTFTAPDPWIFSPAPSGAGTAVADGYYLFLKPLSVGVHVLRYSGGFHFGAGEIGPEPFDISADLTYVITVTP